MMLITLALLLSCNKGERQDQYPGGTWSISVGATPPTINPLSSTTVGATTIQEFALEGLLDADPDTLEWRPGLASSWEVKDNGMTFEFTIRQGVQWHDGKSFTAADVKFSFDIIFRDDYPMQRSRPYFENFHSPTIIGPHKIQFKVKKKYHKNFDVLASGGYFTIVPKHIYDRPKNKKALNKILIGTGPYKLQEIKRGQWALLKKNDQWWGRKVAHLKDRYQFGRVILRFIKESTARLENFKKGKLSYLDLTPEQYMKKSQGGNWGKKYHKEKVQNQSVKGYLFIGFNLKNPLFQSPKVRKAMTHLMNRRLMIKKFMFDLSLLATGPLYQQNPYADPTVRPLEFDPELALKYLREEGWKDSDGDQILDKAINGKKTLFSYTLLIPNKDYEKYLTIFKEDAKRAGVEVKLKLIEWNTFIKHLDERNFEAVMLGWGAGSVQWDPKQVWHSDSRKGGSNFIHYSNQEVDRLIDLARVTMDQKKRTSILRKVYRLIADDAPYIFLFNRKFEFYSYQSNIHRPKPTFNFTIGTSYWKLME